MGDITRNLSRKEFACKCGCGMVEPHPVLCVRSQDLFDQAGMTKVEVRSGTRCKAHNDEVSKASGSYHLVQPDRGWYSLAADYAPLDMTPLSRMLNEAFEIREFREGGIGLYIMKERSFIHLDIRQGPARWGFINDHKVNFGEALAALQEYERRPL